MSIENISDKRFGKLVALKEDYKKQYTCYSRRYWRCICDCGKEVLVRRDHLTRGKTQSCGCKRRERRGHRTPVGHTAFIGLYATYKSSAKSRNLVFSLSKSEFRSLVSQNCFYCNTPPRQNRAIKSYNGDFIYNGLDRLNPSIGYTLENVVPCCGFCNRAKLDLSVDEFLSWVSRISSNFSLLREKVDNYVR